LKKLSSPTATVRRDGKIIEVKAEELVPGDIVILEEGRTVPADLRLIKAFQMKSDESSLRANRLPVEKDPEIVLPAKLERATGSTKPICRPRLFMGVAKAWSSPRA
jgi:Ca2+-transporting ATPase